jgi:chromosome segregation ATPase
LLQSNVMEENLQATENKEKGMLAGADYGDRLRDLDMRLRIMGEEKRRMEIELRKSTSDRCQIEESLRTFRDKQKILGSKLKKLEGELELVDSYVKNNASMLKDKERDGVALEEQIELLRDTIGSLETERIKVNLLIQEIHK